MCRFLDGLCRCCQCCLAGCRVNIFVSREQWGKIRTAKLQLFEEAKALSECRKGTFRPVGGGEECRDFSVEMEMGLLDSCDSAILLRVFGRCCVRLLQ